MKVVINKRYGGFGLSEAAYRRYAEIKGITLYPEKSRFGFVNWWTKPPGERVDILEGDAWDAASMEARKASNAACSNAHIYDRNLDRNDPVLVQVIEELGEKADGKWARLAVVEIPDGIEYEISEYDGMEHIAEKHRTWG